MALIIETKFHYHKQKSLKNCYPSFEIFNLDINILDS